MLSGRGGHDPIMSISAASLASFSCRAGSEDPKSESKLGYRQSLASIPQSPPPCRGRAHAVKEQLKWGKQPAPGPSKALLSPSLWSPWKKVRRMSAGLFRTSQNTSEDTLLQSSKAALTARRTSCCGRYGGQFTTRYVRCRLYHLPPARGTSSAQGWGPGLVLPSWVEECIPVLGRATAFPS